MTESFTVTETEADPSIIEFSVGCSRTINLGNYSSIKVEATVTVEVHEGCDWGELKEKAQKELRALLEETYRAQYKKTNSDAPY